MATLLPLPRARFFTASGAPLAGGKVYSYLAGTSTPKNTYTNSSGTVANTNPVILDSAGEANIWLDGNYKIMLTNSDDVEQWTVDNVSGLPTDLPQWLTVTGVDTIIATPMTAIPGYQTNQTFLFVAAGTNTAPVTINISGKGARDIKKNGSEALAAGDISSGMICQISYDGTQFQLINPVSLDASLLTAKGALVTASALATPATLSVGADNKAIFADSTQSSGLTYDYLVNSRIAVPLSPLGRLTLTSATPVVTTGVTGATTVYYTPYLGNFIPIYNGTTWFGAAFTELSLALDSNSGHTGYQQSGKNFDLFVYSDAGTLRLATGPAWTNDTTRADALARLNGILVNNAPIVLRFGSAADNTATVAANLATYVGTMRASADGQCQFSFGALAVGGTEAKLYLWNLYNRTRVEAMVADSTDSWSYTTTAVRAANGSANWRVSFVTGAAGCDSFQSVYQGYGSSGTNPGFIGIGFDATNAFSGTMGRFFNSGGGNILQTQGSYNAFPGLGHHFVSACEFGDTGTTFYGDNAAPTLTQAQLQFNFLM